ncbi:DUF554 domain-containing protein [Peptococcus simiae]|uniref:DUF554 domain-containing protein n=1 Tax=Peptococcus simiae TaxID=1643805 RepID=A0ABW9H1K1_9FIRM
MLGTLVNVLAIVLGAFAGLLLKRGLPAEVRNLIMQVNGLVVIMIGLKMALKSPNDVVLVVGLCLGALIGTLLKLDDRLNALGGHIKKALRVQDSNFVDGFVSASLIFCIGAMAIVGAFEAGVNHNYDVLFVKSTLDGIMSIVLASTLGVGVVFSGAAILIYQGGLTLLAGVLEPILNDQVIAYMSSSGGLLIVAIGFSVAGIKEFKTANLLPGMFVCGILGYFV